jgi:hypothetical protein
MLFDMRHNKHGLFSLKLFLPLFCVVIGACGGGGGGGGSSGSADHVSAGLKIFSTDGVHNGDFADDPNLTGSTPIEKADNYCQTDSARPDNGTYKALLVDGSNRDAVTHVDWVLKANTVYYQSKNDVEIGMTTAAAVFPTVSVNLDNPIHVSYGPLNTPTSSAWTGLADAAAFDSNSDTCLAWTNSSQQNASVIGVTYAVDASAFYTNGEHNCGEQARIYCVEQSI